MEWPQEWILTPMRDKSVPRDSLCSSSSQRNHSKPSGPQHSSRTAVLQQDPGYRRRRTIVEAPLW